MDPESDFARSTIHGRWMDADAESGLVSVIVPTFNRVSLLTDALESVFWQTYRPIELLVVDDGSRDENLAVLAAWAEQRGRDPAFRIRLLSQAHAGAPAARNLGLIESRGEFIEFLDSDDLLLPQKVEACVLALRSHPAVDYACTQRVFVELPRHGESLLGGLQLTYELPAPVFIRGAAMARLPAQAVLGFFRRSLCREIGPWDETLVRHQDWEYTSRVVAARAMALRIQCPLYAIRNHALGRIDDLRSSRRKALEARLAAARAAETRSIPGARSADTARAIRRRVQSRYWKILRHSAKRGSFRHLAAALQALARLVPASAGPCPMSSDVILGASADHTTEGRHER